MKNTVYMKNSTIWVLLTQKKSFCLLWLLCLTVSSVLSPKHFCVLTCILSCMHWDSLKIKSDKEIRQTVHFDHLIKLGNDAHGIVSQQEFDSCNERNGIYQWAFTRVMGTWVFLPFLPFNRNVFDGRIFQRSVLTLTSLMIPIPTSEPEMEDYISQNSWPAP